ncbi:MAG: porin [Rhizobiaceae bacterium]
MKIKSLLLGSAAASMLAVSGAQAADPIIYAEPESMEYVRICDVYGAGFFYIPGTETCMRISGFARYQMGAQQEHAAGTLAVGYHGFTPGSWNKYARGRINFDVRSETEWGTLRGFVRLEANSGQTVNANGAHAMPWMFISLSTQQGELLAGYLESAWAWSGPIGNYGMHSDTGGAYGFQRRSQIRYTFNAPEGFFGVLSLEDNTRSVANPHPNPAIGASTGRYMPDVVGKAGISQAWGGVYGAFGYDALDESWAARAGAQLNVPNAPGSSLIGTFYWANSAFNAYTPSISGVVGSGARWSTAISYQHQFNPQFAAGIGYQYINHFDGATVAGLTIDGAHTHLADMSLIWTPVRDLEIRTEVGYAQLRGTNRATGLSASTPGTWSGFLRFQRNF